jgi:hypothetical protein
MEPGRPRPGVLVKRGEGAPSPSTVGLAPGEYTDWIPIVPRSPCVPWAKTVPHALPQVHFD